MGHRSCRLLAIAPSLLLWLAGCGELDGDERGSSAALTMTFSNTSPLCPVTTSWGAWAQTPLSTWDNDVEPVVQWIINRTGISSSTYSGHSPSIGRAADWRPHSREEGTDLANWFLANTKSGGKPLGIDYIIWQAQIYLISSGVTLMEDRGSFTQNHCDHIHISFVKSGTLSFDPASTTPWGTTTPPDAGPPPDTAPALDAKAKPPSPDASATGDRARLDAGPSPPPSDDLAPTPPPLSPASPPSSLHGGCALLPRAPTSRLWPLLLLALAAALRRRRRRQTVFRPT